ncbi:DNA primase [Candidatus Parcubacteria bacterium]|nr:DNA primase [Candidatus Parcubacteria bacterium]
MRGNVEEVKDRLDIAEVIGGYVKVDKAGANFKAKCPFHNEKTPSFFISPARQSYYCFGCGAKGDIFTFVEEMEGVDFKEALKTLAAKAGVELKYERGESKGDTDKLYDALEEAAAFFESGLEASAEAKKYLASRGVSDESVKEWRLGYVPEDWRLLREHMLGKGYDDVTLTKAGLIKMSVDHKDKEPYDVFRGRVIFPIFDASGRVIAFSGRALAPDATPKYLNSPDTPLFVKSDVLYGLDKAKQDIRKKDYTVLVEGQLDLVLSHQSGVKNTVASSGTAFTAQHLERLRRLSPRILLAFDSDEAGSKASERSTVLALSLGLEVKLAKMPEGSDPADMVKTNPESWKDVLRKAKPAIEVFLDEILSEEKDARKVGKAIEKKVLPLILLLSSSIERSHFVSLIGKRTGLKEEHIWEDLKRAKRPDTVTATAGKEEAKAESPKKRTRAEELEEIRSWRKENPGDMDLRRQETELVILMRVDELDSEIAEARIALGRGESEALEKVSALSKERDEEKRKLI